jgi:hypothetical protein
LDNSSEVISNYKTAKTYQEAIKAELFESGSEGKVVKDMKTEPKIICRILQTVFFPWNEGTDTKAELSFSGRIASPSWRLSLLRPLPLSIL